MISNIKITGNKTLYKDKFTLSKISYEYDKPDGSHREQTRDIYDRGNAAAVLLYNRENRTVILNKQFRLPAYINGDASGFLIECCAGKMEGDSPAACARREALEETGYKIFDVQQVMQAYMSPGSVTELIYFFIAPYNATMKVNEGGGAKGEEENIDVLEVPIDEAMQMIQNGEIKDAKTIMLLQYAILQNIL